MTRQIFVNLPVKDLNKSVEFFTKLDFTFNPQFTNAKTLPAATVSKMVSRWVRLNYVRDALTLIGWLAALKTFSLPQ